MAIAPAPATPFPLVEDGGQATTGNLNYFVQPPNGEVPYDRLYDDPNLPKTNVAYSRRNTPIYDLRPLVDAGRTNETSTDVTGFQVIPASVAKTSMEEADWTDDAKIRSVYYDETTALFKRVTGASRVIIFDHTIRRVEAPGCETPDTPDSRKPVARVHIDQTPESGRKRVFRHAGEDADRLLAGRAQLINLWRPIMSGPVRDAPIAMADSRTIGSEDLVASRLLYQPPAAEGETYEVAYNDAHRWYYLSGMVKDEAVLLKCWDNGEAGGAKTPHSGFVDDQYVGKDVPPRQSIEVRALVFHE
ncbi:hypothetical protein RQP46_004225 [Phenoliferia psychrophenolica]